MNDTRSYVSCQHGNTPINEKVRNLLSCNVLTRRLFGMPTLGENIRRIREHKKITRRQMAEALGVAAGSSVPADIEADRNEIGVDRLLRVAKCLQVSVEELLQGVDSGYEKLRRDLLGPGSRVTTAPVTKEGAHVVVSPSDARLLRAQQHTIDALTLILGDIAATCDRVSASARSGLRQAGLAHPAQPGRRRRH